ncbi:hypothetical protein Emed_005015 [Eimeria media]
MEITENKQLETIEKIHWPLGHHQAVHHQSFEPLITIPGAPLGPLSEMGNPRPWLFVGSRGVPVCCYSWDVEKPRAVVVLVHGRGSHCMYEWISSSAGAASEAGAGGEAGAAWAGKQQQLPMLPKQQQQEGAHEEVKSSWNCCRPAVVNGEKQLGPHMGRSPSITSSAPGGEGAWGGSVRAGKVTSFSSVNSFSPLRDTDVSALFASAAPSVRSKGSNVPSRAPSVADFNLVEAPAAQVEGSFPGSRLVGQEEKHGLQYYGSWVQRFVSQGLQVVGIDLTQSPATAGNSKDKKSDAEAFDQIAEDVKTLLQSLANEASHPIFLFAASTGGPVAVRAAELLAKAGLLGRPQLSGAAKKQQQEQQEDQQQQQEQQQNEGNAEAARGEEAAWETGSVTSTSTVQTSPVAAAALAMGASHRVVRQRPVPLSGLILLSPVLDKMANEGSAAGGCSLAPWWKSMISLMPRCGIESQADPNSPWGTNLEAGIRAAKADAHWLRRPILREATKPLSISDWAKLFHRQMQEKEARERLQHHIRGGEKAAKEGQSELLIEATGRQQDVLFMRHEEAPQAQRISVLIVQSLDDTTTPPLEAARLFERLGGRAALPEPLADILRQERQQQKEALLAAAAKQQEQQEQEIEKAVEWQTGAGAEWREDEETDEEETASSVTELEQTRESEVQEALDETTLPTVLPSAGVGEADANSTTGSLLNGPPAVEETVASNATPELPLAERMRLAGEGASATAGNPEANWAQEEAAPSVSARSESLLADEEVPWERGSEQGRGTAVTLASATAATVETEERRVVKVVEQKAGWSGLCSCAGGEIKREAETTKATEGAKKLRRRPKKKEASKTSGGWLQGNSWWSCSGQQQQQKQKDGEAPLYEKKKRWGAVEGLVFDEHGCPVDVRAAHACMQEVRLSGFEPLPQIVRYLSKAAVAELSEESEVAEASRVPEEGWQRGNTSVWNEEIDGMASRVISEADGGALQLWVLKGRTHMLTKEAGNDSLQADILSRFVEPTLRRLAGDEPSPQATRETTAH